MNIDYKPMKLVTQKAYLKFVKKHKEVEIEKVKVKLEKNWKIKKLSPPKDYQPEKFNVWSFPDRGDWATHSGNYRGNWSPYIPRNLLLRYTEEGDLVLDQMMGSGTTLVECKLLNRNVIGVDINSLSVMVARDRLNFNPRPLDPEFKSPRILTYEGDARNLNKVKDESIDLIATHPPYANIIPYSKEAPIEGDLSKMHSIEEFVEEMRKVAGECYRVLKPGKHCGILIGDTRRKKHHIPVAFRVLQAFLDVDFILREDVIKHQWKMKSTREKWRRGKGYDFLLLAHEHLFVFRKPEEEEKLTPFKDSVKWW